MDQVVQVGTSLSGHGVPTWTMFDPLASPKTRLNLEGHELARLVWLAQLNHLLSRVTQASLVKNNDPQIK